MVLSIADDRLFDSSLHPFNIGGPSACRHSFFANSDVKGSRPNIVFILADDMMNKVGLTDSTDITPTSIAPRQGDNLTQFGVCAPTRAAFLTGRYAFRTWSDWRSGRFRQAELFEEFGTDLRTEC